MSCGAIRYTLNIIGYLEAYGMSVRIVSCIALVAAVSLSGCGFKSDLFLPEDEEEGNLISERDVQPDPLSGRDIQPDPAELADLAKLSEGNPDFLPSDEVEDSDSMLEKATTAAIDGAILVPASSQSDTGIPVDLSDLTREVERQSDSQ